MDELAATCEAIASWSSRLRKVAILADYLRALDNADVSRAVRFLCCGPIQASTGKFSVGGATLRDAALEATGVSREMWTICHREAGDTGETVSLLMRGKSADVSLSLAETELLYARLFKMRTAEKVRVLSDVFRRHRPATVKFLVKVITGDLRIGLLAKQVEEAIAQATGVALDEIRAANNATGDLPAVAVAARQGTLAELKASLFHPMEFMLAKPLDSVETLADVNRWWMEDKYDGFRSQVHFDRGKVRIFTRGLEEVTEAFPEIVTAFSKLDASAVVDGEILAWQNDRALSFNLLQQRIARKKLTKSMIEDVPVVFIAYDLLNADGAMTTDWPIEQRRLRLSELMPHEPPLSVAPQVEVASAEHVDRAFEEARARGNEGLVLKRKETPYESGKRSGAWLKVKRIYATLDVVVTAAEQGSGRRAIFLSDYTFGVRDGERIVNVGKAYQGLTDAEVRELTRVLRSVGAERFGRVLLVKPEVVLEVAFDGIQKSSRHKGGYALRFPRILRWRRDKRPEESDTLERVRDLYEASIAR